jgi:hypothetical protein
MKNGNGATPVLVSSTERRENDDPEQINNSVPVAENAQRQKLSPAVGIHPAAEVELLAKINEAVAAANEAETAVTTAQAELVSRSRAVGLLLLEAKKLHPAVADFETFLKQVHGLKLSRAYDLLRLAGGRTTDEELKKDARERQQKSRATNKRKLPRPTPAPKKPEPKPISVTDPDVTESAEASAEKRKAINTDLNLSARRDEDQRPQHGRGHARRAREMDLGGARATDTVAVRGTDSARYQEHDVRRPTPEDGATVLPEAQA